jgi:outer membrane protein assembly factor BamA
VRARVAALYTGADRHNFYGFGNETGSDSATSFYHADRRDLLLTAAAAFRPTSRTELSVGPAFRLSTPFREAGTLLDSLHPYGAGQFAELGAQAGFIRDTRNHPTAATAGTLLRLDGRFFPAWIDVAEPFAGLRGEAAFYLAPDTAGSITLALRAGGEKIWGDAPYQEAAYLGGSNTIRGYANRRFAGNASAFGNVELRLPVAGFFLTLPVHFGVFGVADAGRVFADGETSDRWHTGAGGGLWFAALHPANVMTIAVVRGEEQTGLYLRAGFQF